MLSIKFIKNLEFAKAPTKAHDTDLGWDFYSARKIVLGAGDQMLVPTGIHLGLPEGYGMFLKERSGLASKNGIHVLGGVIDPTYTGEVKVILYNSSSSTFYAEVGDKIAQGVLIELFQAEMIEVESLDNTDRGSKGFGSSGR